MSFGPRTPSKEQLLQENVLLRDENYNLKEETANLKYQAMNLKCEINLLREDNRVFRETDWGILNYQRIALLEVDSAEMIKVSTAQKKYLRCLRNENNKLTRERDQLRYELDAERNAHSLTKIAACKADRVAQAKIDVLRKDICRLKNVLNDTKKENEQFQEDIRREKEKTENIRRSKTDVETKLVQASSEISSLRNELQQEKRRSTELDAQLEEAQGRMKGIEESIQTLVKKWAGFRSPESIVKVPPREGIRMLGEQIFPMNDFRAASEPGNHRVSMEHVRSPSRKRKRSTDQHD